MTAWAHLPNAKHIDWVIASLKANPEKWRAARNAVWDEAWEAAYDAALDAIDDAGRYETFDAAYESKEAAFDAAYYAAWFAAFDAGVAAAFDAAVAAADDAILALIAHDDCGYMIESEVGELKIIAAFGDQRAILLLPACIVYNETKVLV